MVAGVENYADTVWHCKSTALSPPPLSSVFRMRFSRVPSAPSLLHQGKKKRKRQCHFYFASHDSLRVLLFLVVVFLLHPFQSRQSFFSAAVPSLRNHATHSDLICSSFLLFPKLQRWHPGVSIDGVFRYIGWSDINSHARSTRRADCYTKEFVSRSCCLISKPVL